NCLAIPPLGWDLEFGFCLGFGIWDLEFLRSPHAHDVLYILKENKTYDQVFGDLPQGNGNPSLCIYPQFVSPNHHALARQFVLLDNFYCNGVNSADGHSWSTEGNNTDHLEESFGGFSRSYTFGDDAQRPHRRTTDASGAGRGQRSLPRPRRR